jgi:hypothetical protein
MPPGDAAAYGGGAETRQREESGGFNSATATTTTTTVIEEERGSSSGSFLEPVIASLLGGSALVSFPVCAVAHACAHFPLLLLQLLLVDLPCMAALLVSALVPHPRAVDLFLLKPLRWLLFGVSGGGGGDGDGSGGSSDLSSGGGGDSGGGGGGGNGDGGSGHNGHGSSSSSSSSLMDFVLTSELGDQVTAWADAVGFVLSHLFLWAFLSAANTFDFQISLKARKRNPTTVKQEIWQALEDIAANFFFFFGGFFFFVATRRRSMRSSGGNDNVEEGSSSAMITNHNLKIRHNNGLAALLARPLRFCFRVASWLAPCIIDRLVFGVGSAGAAVMVVLDS